MSYITEKKKILKMVLLIVLTACIVFGALFTTLYFVSKDKNNTSSQQKVIKFDAPYQGNIMQYDAYLETDRSIVFSSDPSGYGESCSITEDNRKDFDNAVLFISDWISYMQLGNVDAYNSCFSSSYTKKNGLQKSFSQQMIYNTHIYQISTSENCCQYRVEFMLFQNDGSLWDDVESNAVLPRYITIEKTQDNAYVISELITKTNIVIS